MGAEPARSFFAAANARDEATLRASIHAAFKGDANGRPLAGPDDQVRLLQDFWSGFPDGQFTFDAAGGAGRYVVTWTFKGTHSGTYLGVPGNGMPFEVSGFATLQAIDQRISFAHWRWDTKAFSRRLVEAMEPVVPVNTGVDWEARMGAHWRREAARPKKPRKAGGRQGAGGPRPGAEPGGAAGAPGEPGQDPGAGTPEGDGALAASQGDAAMPPGQGPGAAGSEQRAKRRRRRGRGRVPRPGEPEGGTPAAEGATHTTGSGGEGGGSAAGGGSPPADPAPAPAASPAEAAPSSPPAEERSMPPRPSEGQA